MLMKKTKIILIVLFALVLCFIWGNSLLPPETSAKFSSAVGELLSRLFGSGDGEGSVGGMPVRKLAHLVEFCALGVVVAFLLRFASSREVKIGATVTVGLAIPMIDETIQIFSGRGSSLSDVWIDVGGFVIGCAIAYLALYLIEKFKNKE